MRKQVPRLLELAVDEKEVPEARVEVVNAIGWIGSDDPHVVEALQRPTAAKEPRLATAARSMLAKLE